MAVKEKYCSVSVVRFYLVFSLLLGTLTNSFTKAEDICSECICLASGTLEPSVNEVICYNNDWKHLTDRTYEFPNTTQIV